MAGERRDDGIRKRGCDLGANLVAVAACPMSVVGRVTRACRLLCVVLRVVLVACCMLHATWHVECCARGMSYATWHVASCTPRGMLHACHVATASTTGAHHMSCFEGGNRMTRRMRRAACRVDRMRSTHVHNEGVEAEVKVGDRAVAQQQHFVAHCTRLRQYIDLHVLWYTLVCGSVARRALQCGTHASWHSLRRNQPQRL